MPRELVPNQRQGFSPNDRRLQLAKLQLSASDGASQVSKLQVNQAYENRLEPRNDSFEDCISRE